MPVMPMFPLGSVLLPGGPLQLQVFEPRYRAMLTDLAADESDSFGVVLIERGREVGGGETRTDAGTVAQIVQQAELPNGVRLLACLGADRFRVLRWLDDDPYPRAEIEPWLDEPDDEPGLDAALAQVEERMTQLWEIARTGAQRRGEDFDEPMPLPAGLGTAAVLHTHAATAPLGEADRYRVLCAPGLLARARVLVTALDDVLPLFRLQQLDEL